MTQKLNELSNALAFSVRATSGLSGAEREALDFGTIVKMWPLIRGMLRGLSVELFGRRIDVVATLDEALADGKLDVADAMRIIVHILSAPGVPIPTPAPMPAPPPFVVAPPIGTPPGVRPVADEGQEAWVEEMWTPWGPGGEEHVDGAALAAYTSGQKAVPPGSTFRFMTGILPQPSFVPDARRGEEAPFSITHHWKLGDFKAYLSSETDEGNKPRWPIFGRPNGDKGISMGARWQATHGWSVMVTLLPFKGTDPLSFEYWTTREDGTKSNVVSMMVSHA